MMRTFRKLGTATFVCIALSGAALAQPGKGNGGGHGNGNSGRGNDVLQSVINLPQITAPLIHRSGNKVAPVVIHKPSNSVIDNHGNRGIGLRRADFKADQERDAGGDLGDLDRKKMTTKIEEKSEKAEKVEARVSANTANATSRKPEVNQSLPNCR